MIEPRHHASSYGLSSEFRDAIWRELAARRVYYTRVDVVRIIDRDVIAFCVDHAGERRRVEVDGCLISRAGMQGFVAGARKAIDLAEYLDGLRQGMRDLIDQ